MLLLLPPLYLLNFSGIQQQGELPSRLVLPFLVVGFRRNVSRLPTEETRSSSSLLLFSFLCFPSSFPNFPLLLLSENKNNILFFFSSSIDNNPSSCSSSTPTQAIEITLLLYFVLAKIIAVSYEVGEDESQSPTCSFTDLFTNENNVQEEGPLSDREFVKLERDILMDESERSLLNPMVKMETSQTVHEFGSSEADPNFIITREKVKELENELETVLGKLQNSEAETASLNFLLDETNNKLVDMNKHCEELERGQKLMENRVLEAEQKYKFQLISLQEATDMKDKQLSDARKSVVELSMELDSSRKRITVLEEELATSIGEMHKYEELSRHSMSQAGTQSMKVLELGNKLEQAHVNEKDVGVQISNLEKELKELHTEIAEKQVPEALQITSLELSMSQENLEILQSQIVELEQKLASKDAFIFKLTEELNLHKNSEKNLQEDVTRLENALSNLEEDLKRKLVHLKELEMKLQEQMKEREEMEAIFKNQEVQISRLKNNLFDLTKGKKTLECSVMDLTKKLSEHEDELRKTDNIFHNNKESYGKTSSDSSEDEEWKEKGKTKKVKKGKNKRESAALSYGKGYSVDHQRSLSIKDIVDVAPLAMLNLAQHGA